LLIEILRVEAFEGSDRRARRERFALARGSRAAGNAFRVRMAPGSSGSGAGGGASGAVMWRCLTPTRAAY